MRKIKKRSEAIRYARDRLEEQRKYINKVYNVNPENKRQVLHCKKEGIEDSIEIYQNFKTMYTQRKRGKL